MTFKAFKDKETGLWKWGTRGHAIYESKIAAERAGLDALTEGLRRVREKLEQGLLDYGK
jgi:hypothetical protein